MSRGNEGFVYSYETPRAVWDHDMTVSKGHNLKTANDLNKL